MFKKMAVTATMLAALIPAAGIRAASAQAAPNPTAEAVEPGHAYRIDFTLNEIEDGKKINSRQYSMNLNAGDQSEIKIGTRVPVEVKDREIQYLDVGTNIWCRMRDRKDVTWLGNDVLLNVRSEVSSIVPPEPGQGERSMPPLRQLRIEASTIAVVGKPMVVGVVDDPNSKRQFQLEVTATKLR
jgi:hypothetical protein